MNTNKIISLGSDCDLIFALQALNLKGETGIFDWVASYYTEDVVRLIEQKFVGIEAEYHKASPKNFEITTVEHMVHIKNTDICTLHYKLEEYQEILPRRAQRFLDDINGESNILFIRENHNATTMIDKDIIRLENAILSINPNAKFSILIVDCFEDEKTFIPFESKYSYRTFFSRADMHPEGKWWDKSTVHVWKPLLKRYGLIL